MTDIVKPPCVLTTCRESHWGRVHCKPGGRQKAGSWACESPASPTNSRDGEHHLAGREGGGRWSDTKEIWLGSPPRIALVMEPNSWRGKLSFSGDAHGVRCRVGVGIVLPGEREGHLHVTASLWGKRL